MNTIGGEGASSRLTPENDFKSRVNKTILAQHFAIRETNLHTNMINRLADRLQPDGGIIRLGINAISHFTNTDERMGSETGFAKAMFQLGYPETQIMEVWNTKIAIDQRERGLTRGGLPGYTSLSAEHEEAARRAELEKMTRSHLTFSEGDSGTELTATEAILSPSTDPLEVGVNVVDEMLTVRGFREEEALRLGEPFEDPDAIESIHVSNVAGLASQNGIWVRAVVEDEGISPDHAEEIIARRYIDVSSLDIDEYAGLTLDDAREMAREIPIFDSSLDGAIQTQFHAGRSFSDAIWLNSFMEDDQITVDDVGRIATSVLNDSD